MILNRKTNLIWLLLLLFKLCDLARRTKLFDSLGKQVGIEPLSISFRLFSRSLRLDMRRYDAPNEKRATDECENDWEKNFRCFDTT